MLHNTQQIVPERKKSIVLVGLMGAGKTAIGKRLAARLGLPFHDSDQEIERAAGMSVAEIFTKHGEPHFRAGEKRVIERLLSLGPIVLATGGGAFMDAETREVVARQAVSVWLHSPVHILLNRVRGRTHRPLLNNGDPAEILRRLLAVRGPVYALADIIIPGSEDSPDVTTQTVLDKLSAYAEPRRVHVPLSQNPYEVLIGPDLLPRAGALMHKLLAQPRVIIISDASVAALHLPTLQASLERVAISHDSIIVKPGEASKSIENWAFVVNELLSRKVDRDTTIVALGGGVIGDLAGFAAAATLRGLAFIQIPTTLLAQVDSSVGGKTGINAPHGKNLIGAFHQPRLVLADTAILATLPVREWRAGYAEIIKAGLIADASLYAWCEANGQAMLNGDAALLAQAVERAVAFKAAVVGDDEREMKPNGGRALLNLGHTFGHALEAETGYGQGLLHGEAVAVGLILATQLSANLSFCPQEDASRIASHINLVGLPTRINNLPAEQLLAHMKQDKKMKGGKLTFILTRGIGQAFTHAEVAEDAVRSVLLANGAV
ncbi:MAG: 3-dehydroquinate synthase [Acidocella sp.]|nr:3-dehydroquinate synthase [Acidocella sp.]